MSNLFTNPKFQILDSNGVPLAGGKVYTYVVGTTTLATTYSDADLTANTNPILLNERGECVIYSLQALKIKVTDKDDTTVWTMDNIGMQSIGDYYLSNFASFLAAITAIGSNTGILHITAGTWPISTNLTVPSNIILEGDGGVLAIATGVTLTVNGGFDAGLFQVFSCTGTGKVVFTNVEEVRPEWWGVTGTADNVAIQAALTTLKVVRLTPLKTYTMAAGITWDVGYNSMIGVNSLLDFSALTTGTAITTVNTNPGITGNPYNQTGNTLDGFEVKGNNTAVTGISYETAAEPGVSHIQISKVNVHGFGNGIYFGDNAYAIQHVNCDIWNNTVGVYTKAGATNGGENLSFIGGSIFNNATNVSQNNGASDLTFTNVSIDYPTVLQFALVGGMIKNIGCHIENAAVPLLSQSLNTNIDFIDCWTIQQSSSGATPYVTVGAICNFIGGRLSAHASTDPVVRVIATAALNWHGTMFQYSGATKWNLQTGSYFDIVDPDGSSHNQTSKATESVLPISTSGIFSGGKLTLCLTVNAWVNLGTGWGGLFVFNDGTSTGMAVFSASAAGAIQIQNNIGNFEMRYSGGQMQVRVTGGTVPRGIYWTLLQTNQ